MMAYRGDFNLLKKICNDRIAFHILFYAKQSVCNFYYISFSFLVILHSVLGERTSFHMDLCSGSVPIQVSVSDIVQYYISGKLCKGTVCTYTQNERYGYRMPYIEAYAAHHHQTHSVNIILDFSICRNRNIHMKLFNRKYKKK